MLAAARLLVALFQTCCPSVGLDGGFVGVGHVMHVRRGSGSCGFVIKVNSSTLHCQPRQARVEVALV